MNVNLSLRNRARRAFLLDEDDPGETFETSNLNDRTQDEAFQQAMRKAMENGKENVVEGIKTQDSDGRVLRTIRAVAYVPSASSMSNVGSA